MGRSVDAVQRPCNAFRDRGVVTAAPGAEDGANGALTAVLSGLRAPAALNAAQLLQGEIQRLIALGEAEAHQPVVRIRCIRALVKRR